MEDDRKAFDLIDWKDGVVPKLTKTFRGSGVKDVCGWGRHGSGIQMQVLGCMNLGIDIDIDIDICHRTG